MSVLRFTRNFQTYESLAKSLYSRSIPPVKLSYELINKQSSTLTQNTPILILHGLFGSKLNNRTLGQKLNASLERDVYLLDLRNHGDSDHSPDHSYPALSTDIENFIQERKLEECIVVGHSMGAKAGMALSLRRPDLVKLMINVDNAPVNLPPNGGFLKYVDALEKIEKMNLTKLKEAVKEFNKIESNPLISSFILQNLKRNDQGILKSRVPLKIMKDALISGEISSWKFTPQDGHIFTKSTLFMRGLQSKYLVDDYIMDIAKFYTNFEIKDLDCGHFVLYEKAEESVELIEDFIRRNEDD